MLLRKDVAIGALTAMLALGVLACEVEEDAGEDLVPDEDEEVDEPEEEST